MTLFRTIVLLFTGASLSIGIGQFWNNDAEPTDEETTYRHCFEDDELFAHLLEDLDDSDRALVEAKIAAMLEAYGVTEDDLYDDYELRHEFMEELYDFLYDNDLIEDWHHHGMGYGPMH